jgi:hypothetical protein
MAWGSTFAGLLALRLASVFKLLFNRQQGFYAFPLQLLF